MPINLYTAAKYLDQPLLTKTLGKRMPYVMAGVGSSFLALETLRAKPTEKQTRFVQTASVLLFTILSAFLGKSLANRFGDRITQLMMSVFKAFSKKNFVKHLEPEVDHNSVEAAEKLIQLLRDKYKQVPEDLLHLIKRTKTKYLHPGNVGELRQKLIKLAGEKEGDELLNHIIPAPSDKNAAEIFGEIGDLSLQGLFPVLGGITGGLVGNALNGEDWAQKLKDQSKEGFYQFFANIFLCNVGAGLFLAGTEAVKFSSERTAKVAKFGAMITGILAMGVLGGSSIANFFGNNFINPLFDEGFDGAIRHVKDKVRNEGVGSLFKNLNSERSPELMDVGLHIDDVATVGVFAGLKWIEPMLLGLYSLSGYRAGIGYRNGDKKESAKKPAVHYPAVKSALLPPAYSNSLSAQPLKKYAPNSPFVIFYQGRFQENAAAARR